MYWRIFLTTLLVCAGGSLHYGIQLTILNPSEHVFRRFINDTHHQHHSTYLTDASYRLIWSIVLNSQLIGTLFGTLPVAKLSESLGRRRSFYIACLINIVGLILQSISKACSSYELLTVGRFVGGFGQGLVLPLEVMYFNEISPIDRRGFFGSMTGIFVEVGFIVGGLLSLPQLFGTDEAWQYMFVVELIPIAGLFGGLFFLHDSPRYLLSKGQIDRATEALEFFQHSNAEQSAREIQNELRQSQDSSEVIGFKELWRKKHLRRAVVLSSAVILTSSFSGIVIIDYFSTQILIDVGFARNVAQYVSLGIFAQTSLSAIFGGYLVERVGRRLLLLITTALLIVSNAGLMVFNLIYEKYSSHASWAGYASVACCLAMTLAFGFGPAVLQWIVAAEMVPQNARAQTQLVVMLVQKVACILAGITFFPLQGVIGPYAFALFIMPLITCLVVFWFRFPETKGKTVLEIMRVLGYEEGMPGVEGGKLEKFCD